MLESWCMIKLHKIFFGLFYPSGVCRSLDMARVLISALSYLFLFLLAASVDLWLTSKYRLRAKQCKIRDGRPFLPF